MTSELVIVTSRNFARYHMHLARITFDNFAAALHRDFYAYE